MRTSSHPRDRQRRPYTRGCGAALALSSSFASSPHQPFFLSYISARYWRGVVGGINIYGRAEPSQSAQPELHGSRRPAAGLQQHISER